MTPEGDGPARAPAAIGRPGSSPRPYLGIATWEWDLDTGQLWWSDEAYRILGLDPLTFTPDIDQVAAMTIEEDRWLHRPQELGDPPGPYSIYYRIRRPDGAVRTLRETGGPSPHWTAQSRRVTGTVMDVTDCADQDPGLAYSLGGSVRIGTWRWHLDTDQYTASPETLQIYGLPADGVVCDRERDLLIHPEDRARVVDLYQRSSRIRAPFHHRYRILRPNGEVRFLDEEGRPAGPGIYEGRIIDVTERTRTEQNLADAQRIAMLGSWSVDQHSQETRWSPQMYRLIGVEPGVAKPSIAFWAEYIHPDDRARVLATYADTDWTRQSYAIQYRVIRTDTQTRYMLEQCEYADGAFSGYVMDITERHKVQRHLAKAQEIARIGSWEFNPATEETWLSDEVYRMLGLDPLTWQHSRERWQELIHPDDRDRTLAACREAAAKSEGYSIQFQLRQRDGSYRLYFEQSEVSDAGTLTGILWDITDLTRAQRNMSDAQRIARIGSWEWEVTTDQHWWSTECYRILGLDPDQMAASDAAWAAVTHPDDTPWTNAEFDAALRERRAYSYQYRIVRPDGQVRTVFETGELVAADKYAGTVMDVTDRVKIETRLAESQRIAKLGTWEWDLATDQRTWSEECYRIYGVPSAQQPVTRATWRQTILPEDLPAILSLMDSVEANPRPYTYRCRIRHADGAVRTLQVHGEPVADYGPGNAIIAGTTLDITERESIESQLQHAQKMEAVGQLTGGIAHDFNNLLGAVLGNLDLLLDEVGDRPRARTLAGRAVAAAESGAQLVRRLLAFSRKQTLDAQVTDINELIVNMLDLLRRSLGDKAQINTSLGAGPIPCVIDRAQTEGALLNLCINARDAMPDGGVATVCTRIVTIGEHRRAGLAQLRSGRYVELSVADTGVGMSSHVLERAFEPFFTTKAPGKGSGLGLSMVYGFVKQSDGHIEIESQPAIGTTVRIYLPIHAGAAVAAAEQALPAPTGGRELVLVVEDNPDLRSYAVNTIRSFGYRALSAPCARAAMKLIDTRPDIALLFTDIVFRDGPTGIQLADMAHSKRPELPVLLTSGYLGDRAVQERIGQPNTFTIAKPFRAPELGRKLAEILHQEAEPAGTPSAM